MTAEWIGLFVALLFSAFFSGTETAYTAASRLSMEVYRRHHRRGAHAATRLFDNATLLFSTTLVGNNLVGVAYSSLAALILARYGVPLGWIVVISPALVLVFGEVLPKTIARERPEPWAMRAATPLWVVHGLLLPLIALARASSNIILALLRAGRDSDKAPVTLGELRGLWGDLRRSGRLAPEEIQLLDQAVTLRGTKVRDIMTPRTDIVGLPLDASVEEAEKIVSSRGLTRIPVYEGSLDRIAGVVNVIELLGHPTVLSEALRPVHHIPEQAPGSKLLELFRRGGPDLAVVVDEHGGTAGIITMEDVIEELVGEIEDEHDPSLRRGRRISRGTYLVSGRAELDRLDEELDISLPAGDYSTVAGLMIDRLGTIPELGESVDAGNWSLRVVAVDERRIKRVLIRWRRSSDERRAAHVP